MIIIRFALAIVCFSFSFSAAFGNTFGVNEGTRQLILEVDLGLDTYRCQVDGTTVVPTISGGSPPYTYQWSSTASNLSCDTCAAPTIIVNVSSQITVIVTDANGLTATDTVNYDVNPLPSTDIIGDTAIIPQTAYTYQVSSEPGIRYRWFAYQGSIISGHGTHAIVVVWGYNGSYSLTLEVEDNTGCMDGNYLSIVKDTTIGILTPENILSIAIYPNPTQGNVMLDIHTNQQQKASIHITDVVGTLVLKEQVLLKAGENTLEMGLSQFASGLYLVRLLDENGNALGSYKVVKQ